MKKQAVVFLPNSICPFVLYNVLIKVKLRSLFQPARLSFSTESVCLCLCLQTVFVGFGFCYFLSLSFLLLLVVAFFRSHCFNNKDNYFQIIRLHLFPVFVPSDSILEKSELFLSCFQSVLVLI